MLHDLFKHSTCFFPQLFFDIKPTKGAQPEIFQDRGGFVKLGHFNKHFVKNSRKKGSAGKISEFFQKAFFI